jgi:hypothetical protein
MMANSTHKGLRLTVLIAASSGIIVGSSCTREGPPSSSVREEMTSVRERTVPLDAVPENSSDPKRTQYSVIAEWEFETSKDNSVYLEWVSQQLERDFSLKTSGESTRTFLKRFSGDVESVSIITKPSNGKLLVRVTNSIYPD